MQRFDKAQAKEQDNGIVGTVEPIPTANGIAHDEISPPASSHKRKERDDEEEDLSEVEDSSPAPKKVKKTNGATESDEKLAARLQAELNAQTRSTRGGGTTKRKPVAKKEKKAKKKSKAKINSDDDSAVEGEDKPEKEKKGGFHVSWTDTKSLGIRTDNLPEAYESFRTTFGHARRKPALPSSNREEDMGVRQSTRPAGSLRQTQHPVRRCDAGRVQERQSAYVHHEQTARHSSLSRRRSVTPLRCYGCLMPRISHPEHDCGFTEEM